MVDKFTALFIHSYWAIIQRSSFKSSSESHTLPLPSPPQKRSAPYTYGNSPDVHSYVCIPPTVTFHLANRGWWVGCWQSIGDGISFTPDLADCTSAVSDLCWNRRRHWEWTKGKFINLDIISNVNIRKRTISC